MTAKEYLSQLKTLYFKINQKIKEAEELRTMAYNGKGLQIDGDKVKASLPQSSPQHNTIEKYIDLQAVIDSEIDEYADLKHKIINEIHQLEDSRYINILYLHYVPNDSGVVKQLEDIADAMNYSYIHIRRLHGEALNEFEKKMIHNDT